VSFYTAFFCALNVTGIRYVVVGGVATVLHGHARLTADVDLILDLEGEAAARAMRALTAHGLRPRVPVNPEAFADPRIRRGWIQDKGMQVFSFFKPDNPLLSVDVFVDHPIEFEGLYERSVICSIDSCPVRIASIPDLIQLKRLANRPQDREDIARLEEILRLKRERDGA
jgi:hypothetical protein